jgi:hypothetical protein
MLISEAFTSVFGSAEEMSKRFEVDSKMSKDVVEGREIVARKLTRHVATEQIPEKQECFQWTNLLLLLNFC